VKSLTENAAISKGVKEMNFQWRLSDSFGPFPCFSIVVSWDFESSVEFRSWPDSEKTKAFSLWAEWSPELVVVANS